MLAKITDMKLPYLSNLLRNHEEEILTLIDNDPLLRKRERKDGLVIANASKSLYEPEYEHQLFAKGIVYQRNPYRLVSLPLIKIHNYGARDFSDRACEDLCNTEGITLTFPEKKDGTMIQVFEHCGEVIFTTRSVMEDSYVVGQEDEDDFVPYVQIARELAEKKYPKLLNPSHLEGRSLVFELVHPTSRVVTDYGDTEELCLIAVYDLISHAYWDSAKVSNLASFLETPSCFYIYKGRDLNDGLASVNASLKGRKDVPEGVVICFEKDGIIHHRVKYKMEEYLKRHTLKFQVSLKSVALMLWNKPELHDWDAFHSFLKEQGLTEEEVEDVYREYFDEFMKWKHEVHLTHMNVIANYKNFCVEYKGEEQDFQKSLAIWTLQHHPENFHLVMTCHKKKGDLAVIDVMKVNQIYPGFKTLLG